MHSSASNAATLPINSPKTWAEFSRCVSLGIAPYQEQAHQLANSSLRFPDSNGNRHGLDLDLLFYPVIRDAYRKGKLLAFLEFMRLAKSESYWHVLRGCKETQSTVIDVFLRKSSASISDAIRLLPLWMNLESQIDEVCFNVPNRESKIVA